MSSAPHQEDYLLSAVPGFRPNDNGKESEPFGFGDATGIWGHFDQMAAEYNDATIKTLTQHLDTLLIFAALFSSVNSGFLQFSFPLLSPDPSDQTNALLLLLVQGVQNATLTADAITPAFHPSASAIYANRLFTSSLTTSLIAAFGAVLGKQWLTHYAKSYHGSQRETRRQIQRKIGGAERWFLRSAIQVVLPTTLQVALVLFILGLVSFLDNLNPNVAALNIRIAWVGLGILIFTSVAALCDPSCPFQTPLTRSIIPNLLIWCIRLPIYVLMIPTALGVLTFGTAVVSAVYAIAGRFQRNDMALELRERIKDSTAIVPHLLRMFHSVVMRYVISQGVRIMFGPKEDPTILDVRSVCWTFSSTNDIEVLHTVAESIPSIYSTKTLDYLFADDAIRRLYRLFWDSANQLETKGQSERKKILLQDVNVYGKALLHLFLYVRMNPVWWHTDVERVIELTCPAIADIKKEMEQPGTADGNAPDIQMDSEADIADADPELPGASDSSGALPPVSSIHVATAIKLLLFHKFYSHTVAGTDAQTTDGAESDVWEMDETRMERLIYRRLDKSSEPGCLSLGAWAFGTLPHRVRKGQSDLLMYQMEKKDLSELWDTYKSDSHFLKNVALALKTYSLHGTEVSCPPTSSTILANLLAGTKNWIECTSSNTPSPDELLVLGQLAEFSMFVNTIDPSPEGAPEMLREADGLMLALSGRLDSEARVLNSMVKPDTAAALAHYAIFLAQREGPRRIPDFLSRFSTALGDQEGESETEFRTSFTALSAACQS